MCSKNHPEVSVAVIQHFMNETEVENRTIYKD